MNKCRPGDIIREAQLGLGMVVYYETSEHPICAFPLNPELVVCADGAIHVIANISEIEMNR